MGLKPPINVGQTDPPKAGYNGWRVPGTSPPDQVQTCRVSGRRRVMRRRLSSGAFCPWFAASPNRVLLRFVVADLAPFPS